MQDHNPQAVPSTFRVTDEGMELPDGTLIVDCGHGVGIYQPLGNGEEQAFYIAPESLHALTLCLNLIRKEQREKK